jgi:hypothetical protein
MGAAPAVAQSVRLHIAGAGVLSVNGEKTQVAGVDYAVIEETHRTSISVRLSEKQTVTFSGDRALEAGSLPIDAVLVIGGRAIKDEAAQGSCVLSTSEGGAIVRTLSCNATTKSGAYALEFTGDGTPLTAP